MKKRLSDIIAQRSQRAQNIKRLIGIFLLLICLYFVYQRANKPNPISPNCTDLATLTDANEVKIQIENCWKTYTSTYDTATTFHFRCRLNCRQISMKDIYSVLENGKLENVDVLGCKNSKKDPNLINPCLEIWGNGRTGDLMCLVVALTPASKTMNFITAYRKKGGPKCDVDCDFIKR